MDVEAIEFEPVDTYEKKCGEMFLATSGDITFLCTLCDSKYMCFQDYADHLMEEHYDCSTFDEYGLSTEAVQTDEDICDDFIREEDSYSIGSQELTVKNALEETELSIADLNQESTLDVVLKHSDSKEDDTAYIESDQMSDATSSGKKSNINITKKSSRQLRRRHRSYSKSPGKRCFKCTECDFSCTDKSNLMGHIKRHSNEKPHRCNECHKEFYTRTELKSHNRTHTGERPFLCTDCGRTFITSGSLTAHVKRHKNIRDKECSVCHKRFFDTPTLVGHMRIHTGERPFKCKLCSSSFKRGNALRSHMKMHENKREYQCEFCTARFNQKCNLIAHRKSKHLLALSANVEHPMESGPNL